MPRRDRAAVLRCAGAGKQHPDPQVWAAAVAWASVVLARWRWSFVVFAVIAVAAVLVGLLGHLWVLGAVGMIEAVAALGTYTTRRAAWNIHRSNEDVAAPVPR